MANPTVDNGGLTDYPVASDDDGSGNNVQLVKLVQAADAQRAAIAADGSGLEVQLGAALPAGTNNIGDVDVASSALPTGAATSAKQDTVIGHLDGVETALTAIQTAVQLLDDAISGTEMQVDVLSSALPSGASTSAKQDTVIGHLDGVETALSAIQTAVEALDNAISGSEMQVDIVGALPAGNNNIGDVDIASLPTVTIQDGGNTITVDGNVTAGNFTQSSTSGDITAQDEAVTLSPGALATVGALVTGTFTGTLWFEGSVDGTTWVQIQGVNPSSSTIVDELTAPGTVLVPSGGFLSVRLRAEGSFTGTATVTLRGRASADVGYTINPAAGEGSLTEPVSVDDNGGSLTVDNAALTELAAAIDTEVQVDVVGALPAGTNNIGDVDIASIAAGDNNIGNVDVVTLPSLPAGTNAIGKLAANSGVDIGDVDVTSSALPTGASTSANQSTIITSLQLIDDIVKTDDAAFTVGTDEVAMAGMLADETSTDSVDEGDAGAPRMTLNRQQIVTVRPNASGEGLDVFRTLDADETEEDVKTSAGKLYGWHIYNDGAAEVYVKFYNATAANTTVGSTTPKMTVPIPAGSAANVEFTNGIVFDTAICIAATTAVGDADSSAPAANQVVANILYK